MYKLDCCHNSVIFRPHQGTWPPIHLAMAYSWIQSARVSEAEAQYQVNLREAREAVDELVRHIHVSWVES